MNNFQRCHNTTDSIPLYLPQQLYLKPLARLNISVQLPQKKMGKSISNLEVSEQLRSIIKPETFSFLKVITTNLEFIRFEAEIDDKTKLNNVIIKLDKKTMKLKEFSELLKIRASQSKLHFPSRHEWDTFFREAKNMNEMKPGERPDTIHISNLPIKWFVPYHLMNDNTSKPSEKTFYRVFQKFGSIRCIDIPICDPYRNKMKTEVSGLQTFSFDEEQFFEGYVQFKDYIGFSKAMDALRGMKLLRKEEDQVLGVNIIVDYDRTKHLSEASKRRREIVRDRLVRKDIVKEEHKRLEKEEEDKMKENERKKKIDEKIAKEQRRREREEKRKAKILAKLKVNSADEINDKIAKEEKKLLKAQRKLESIRMIEALFQRIKVKHEKHINTKLNQGGDEDELTRMKNISELEVHQQKEKLNRVIEGRVILKTLLLGDQFNCKRSSSSESSETDTKKRKRLEKSNSTVDLATVQNDWRGYLPGSNFFACEMGHGYQNSGLGGPSHYYSQLRGRGAIPGSSRGPRRYFRGRYRGGFRGGKGHVYPPELQEQYYRYFEKFLYENDDRSRRSRSKSRSRSYSRHRERTRSRSRSRSRSRRYRSRTRSRSRSNRRRRSSSRSTSSYKYGRSSRRRSRTRSQSQHRKSKKKERSRSPSYRSIDSSKFISPSRLRMPRSKSWSLPKENSTNKT